jgi:hypothetical protein
MPIGPVGPRLPPPTPQSAVATDAAARPVRSGAGPAPPSKTFLQVLSEGQRTTTARPDPQATTAGGSARPGTTGRSSVNQTRPTPPPRNGAPVFQAMVDRTLRAEATVDGLIAAAARGRTFSAGELIALQATVFRYSQTVEVISRAADRLVGSIKQTLGTQV